MMTRSIAAGVVDGDLLDLVLHAMSVPIALPSTAADRKATQRTFAIERDVNCISGSLERRGPEGLPCPRRRTFVAHRSQSADYEARGEDSQIIRKGLSLRA